MHTTLRKRSRSKSFDEIEDEAKMLTCQTVNNIVRRISRTS